MRVSIVRPIIFEAKEEDELKITLDKQRSSPAMELVSFFRRRLAKGKYEIQIRLID